MPGDFARFAGVLRDPLLLVGRDGTILEANEAAAALVGAEKSALIGRPLAACTNEPDKVPPLLALFARTRQAIPGTLNIANGAGRVTPCRCEGGVYTPASDEAPATLLIRLTPKDVSDRRFIALNQQIADLSMEIRRRIATEARLYEQREWLRVTLASIGDAVIATDTESRITFINPTAAELTGWREEDAVGVALTDVFNIVNETTREPVESPTVRVLREGIVAGLANHTILIRPDGSEVPIADSGAPIRDAHGKIIGTVLVFHDITERRALEGELKRRAEELAALNRRKDEFLAMLSHELRNPLAPISNSLAILQTHGAPDARMRPVLDIMQRQLRQLTRLVDDLLDVSRITTGRIRVVHEPVELDHVVAKALEAVTPAINSRRQRLAVHREHHLVQGDEARLTQVIVNLLDNASKYTPEAGRIELRVRRSGEHAEVAVEDDGIGLEPEMLPQIFELFTQLDRAPERVQSGLGIGLALVKTLVEMHGGSVDVQSGGRGAGSRFTVRLPLAGSDAAAA